MIAAAIAALRGIRRATSVVPAWVWVLAAGAIAAALAAAWVDRVRQAAFRLGVATCEERARKAALEAAAQWRRRVEAAAAEAVEKSRSIEEAARGHEQKIRVVYRDRGDRRCGISADGMRALAAARADLVSAASGGGGGVQAAGDPNGGGD